MMVKTTKTKIFNTETAKIVGRLVSGVYGDPAGYELTMYETPEGDFFLYSYGGADSPYPKEKITAYTKAAAKKWLDAYNH